MISGVAVDVISTCVERVRGDEEALAYLAKQVRTLNDMLDGKPVRPWRLERLRKLVDEIGRETLSRTSSPGCGTTTLRNKIGPQTWL